MSSSKPFDLSAEVPAGERRFWEVKHQPNKQAKPLRLELRQWNVVPRTTTPPSFSDLVGFIDTIADELALAEAAKILLTRVGEVDRFVGVHGA